ncbi:MAG: hypothetical protein ACK4TF_02550 [Thermodesulfovibrionales bacterium]
MKFKIFPLNIFSFFVVALLGSFIFACSKSEVKKPSEEAIAAKEAIELVNTIKEAYMTNNEDRIRELSASDEVIKKISFSDKPSDLEFIFRWIEIKDNKAEVYVSWKALWPQRENSKNMDVKGFCLFILEGKPFRLVKIMRENPFQGQLSATVR